MSEELFKRYGEAVIAAELAVRHRNALLRQIRSLASTAPIEAIPTLPIDRSQATVPSLAQAAVDHDFSHDAIRAAVEAFVQQKNLPQAQIARILGISDATLLRWRRGDRVPDRKSFLLLSRHDKQKRRYWCALAKYRNPHMEASVALLQGLRERTGQTWRALALALDVRLNQLSDWNRGRRLPDAESCEKFARIDPQNVAAWERLRSVDRSRRSSR